MCLCLHLFWEMKLFYHEKKKDQLLRPEAEKGCAEGVIEILSVHCDSDFTGQERRPKNCLLGMVKAFCTQTDSIKSIYKPLPRRGGVSGKCLWYKHQDLS